MPTKKNIDYQELSQELDQIMAALQNEDIGIDEAVKKYERGMELIELLQGYLEQAENKVEKIKKRFDLPKGE